MRARERTSKRSFVVVVVFLSRFISFPLQTNAILYNAHRIALHITKAANTAVIIKHFEKALSVYNVM